MTHNFHKTLLYAAFGLISTGAYSQTMPRKITLDEALSLGIKNNSYLKISEIKTEIAEAKLQQVRDGNLPKAGLSLQASRLYILDPFAISANLGLPVSHFDAMFGIASVSKEIFGGFIERAKHQTNEALVQASKMDAEKDKSEIEYNIRAIYYTIYKIGKSEFILDENLRLLDEKERQATNLKKEGVLLSNDILKIQLQKSNLLMSKVDVKNALDISLYNLAVLIGIPASETIVIDTTVLLDAKPLPPIEELIQQALESRFEVKASGFRIKAAEGGLKQVKSYYYPHLEASGMYIYVNPALNHAVFPEKGGYLSALNLGVALKYNIGSLYSLKGKMQEARLNITQSQNALTLQNEQVRTTVFSQYKTYQASIEKIKVSETSLNQATESFEISSSQFKNGLLLTGDLMQSQNLLLQSQLNVLQAKIEAQLAYLNLQKALGGPFSK